MDQAAENTPIYNLWLSLLLICLLWMRKGIQRVLILSRARLLTLISTFPLKHYWHSPAPLPALCIASSTLPSFSPSPFLRWDQREPTDLRQLSERPTICLDLLFFSVYHSFLSYFPWNDWGIDLCVCRGIVIFKLTDKVGLCARGKGFLLWHCLPCKRVPFLILINCFPNCLIIYFH